MAFTNAKECNQSVHICQPLYYKYIRIFPNLSGFICIRVTENFPFRLFLSRQTTYSQQNSYLLSCSDSNLFKASKTCCGSKCYVCNTAAGTNFFQKNIFKKKERAELKFLFFGVFTFNSFYLKKNLQNEAGRKNNQLDSV